MYYTPIRCYNQRMKTLSLSIYPEFQCKADKCLHSCCIGWEIDIDEETFERFLNISGDLGKKIRDNTEKEPVPHFVLDKDERCPFLDHRGLCEIILEKGESFLCDICRDHPRYRNPGHLGLGLCCEEVARLFVETTDPITLIELNEENFDYIEYDVTQELEELISIFNSSLTLKKKMESCAKMYGIDLGVFEKEETYQLLMDMERLDVSWEDYLKAMEDPRIEDLKEDENKIFSNVAIYFLHRYLPQSYDEDSFADYLRFAFWSVRTIIAVFRGTKGAKADLIELLRLYSSEIEYSDENIDKAVFN